MRECSRGNVRKGTFARERSRGNIREGMFVGNVRKGTFARERSRGATFRATVQTTCATFLAMTWTSSLPVGEIKHWSQGDLYTVPACIV